MKMTSVVPTLAVRSSIGLQFVFGPPSFAPNPAAQSKRAKDCRILLFCPNGLYFACGNAAGNVEVLATANWSSLCEITRPRACQLAFSPKSTYLQTWEVFVVNSTIPNGAPNLNIYNPKDGSLVTSLVQKRQVGWQPQWSSDEFLCSTTMANNEVVFYENSNFDKFANKISQLKVKSYSVSPHCSPYYVVCHVAGGAGQPSLGRLFKYPNFEQALATKTFFQADSVKFYWNARGTSVLLLTTVDVDKTGASYYGKQALHYASAKGDTALVTFNKEGPISDVCWSPNSNEFCCVYGHMPASATLFNLKCEPVAELGSHHVNSIYFNPHGNLLLLGGFGNLRGHIVVWDVKGKKEIGQCQAPDTTQLHWSPDGQHFATATTAPRLRIDNGYKLWHYSGSLLHERPWPKESGELYEVAWQTYAGGAFKEASLSYRKVEGIAQSQPQASKEAYRPPSARLRDANKPPPAESPQAKAAAKMKKKREAKKAKKIEEEASKAAAGGDDNEATTPKPSGVQVNLTGDPEKDKKIKGIKKKLDAIHKLKDMLAEGKTLELNQVAKIDGEAKLLQELKSLQL